MSIQNSSTKSFPADLPERTRPWWREPMMWLVVGGPSLVVVASFATLGLAIINPDPVLQEQVAASSGAKSMQPAKEARNHAATGGK